jgi:hypothetical protein
MDRTSFQIGMEPHIHTSLKTKANMFRITIGAMIENLLVTLEHRVKKVQEQIEGDGVSTTVARDSNTEKRIIELILKTDMDELTNRQFKAKINKLATELSDEATTPELKLRGIRNE